MAAITPNDIVLLISPDHKRFVLRLNPGDEFHTHRGIIPHDDILGQPFGSRIPAHTGAEFVVLKPSFEELLMSVTRATQILYPKDIGYILLKLSVYPGVRVVEAGTGSGAMTMALAPPILRHRMALNFAARADGVSVDQVIGHLTKPLL